MPRGNGMGPMGMGPRTGRGRGFCVYGGYGRSMRRFLPWGDYSIGQEKERRFLENEKSYLEARLNEIEKILKEEA